ncbi:MAG: hypothetical protein JWM33_3697, partial [Caulobacteraceae bacterium]|nr:hypothetical protein [Caulobacteraceae bacterium]
MLKHLKLAMALTAAIGAGLALPGLANAAA